MPSTLTKQDYIDYIRLQLSGGLLELEIEDEVISKFIDASLVELRRYYNVPIFITVPYARAIDTTGFDCSAVTGVYRSSALMTIASGEEITKTDLANPNKQLSADVLDFYQQYPQNVDPMYVQQWAAFSGAGLTYNLQNYVMNYAAYSTLTQMQNTTSTDMSFIEDKKANKLYINCMSNIPSSVTIEYIPSLKSVEEVTDDYWIDILKRLSLALVKVALGRIRTRFTQSNALWTQDGETLLTEGNEELKELRELLRVNDALFLPRD